MSKCGLCFYFLGKGSLENRNSGLSKTEIKFTVLCALSGITHIDFDDILNTTQIFFFKLRFSPLFIYFYLVALGLSCGMWDPYILVTAYGI